MDSRNVKDSPIEGVDFNKVRHIIRSNKFWLFFILILANSLALLKIRYTKDVYESETVIKLDLEKNASDLGIKGISQEVQSAGLISGEIEVIQSRLFLSRVLDSMDLAVSFYSIGHVLDFDLFPNPPAIISYEIKDRSFYDKRIYYTEIDDENFTLEINGVKQQGKYGKKVVLPDANLILIKNESFINGDEVGYYFIVNSKEALLNYFLANLTVEPLNFNANTIRVAFKDNNVTKAHDILTMIDNLYVSYSNEQKNLANKQKIDWVTNELRQIESKMEDYEDYFKNYILKNKSTDVDEDLRLTITIINAIDSQRFEVSSKINTLNQLLDSLAVNKIPASFIENTLPENITNNLIQIQQLSLEEDKLKMSYKENTFPLRQKKNSVTALKNKTLAILIDTKNNYLKKLKELNKRKASYESDFANIPDQRNQFTKNERFYKLYEEFYLTMMKSKSEYEIAIAGTTPDFKILTPATQPSKPIYPNQILVAGIGLSSGLIMMLFFIGILYVINNKITNLQEIEKAVTIPVLGVIPSSRNLRSGTFHILEHPKSMVSESIRIIRTNLDFFKVSTSHKIIAISSTVSGEGKSFIAMNLSGVIAQSKKKVILLDLDMRKPKTELPIHIEDKTKGVSTILIKKNTWQECVNHSPIENLDYLASGPHPPNPSELLLNSEFTNLLEELKKIYDFIILDTPPVGLVTDGIMAMKQADISIYIFRANYSKQYFPENLNRIITINKFSNITILMNALPAGTERGYGYGYYEEPKKLTWLQLLLKKLGV
ncbi:MAG TPA: polysaccharide biosynthesis tyrosine autokinase [Cyclobacteriaceae bacterium]